MNDLERQNYLLQIGIDGGHAIEARYPGCNSQLAIVRLRITFPYSTEPCSQPIGLDRRSFSLTFLLDKSITLAFRGQRPAKPAIFLPTNSTIFGGRDACSGFSHQLGIWDPHTHSRNLQHRAEQQQACDVWSPRYRHIVAIKKWIGGVRGRISPAVGW